MATLGEQFTEAPSGDASQLSRTADSDFVIEIPLDGCLQAELWLHGEEHLYRLANGFVFAGKAAGPNDRGQFLCCLTSRVEGLMRGHGQSPFSFRASSGSGAFVEPTSGTFRE
jgi:hypothetical protein